VRDGCGYLLEILLVRSRCAFSDVECHTFCFVLKADGGSSSDVASGHAKDAEVPSEEQDLSVFVSGF